MKMKEWRKEVSSIYEELPSELKNYRVKGILKSIALDPIILQDFAVDNELAVESIRQLFELREDPSKEKIERLVSALDNYYGFRREDGRWEEYVFGRLSSYELPPVFVLSYNRPAKNATLDRLDQWNDDEVYSKTTVFVQPEQLEAYKKNHPKFNYFAKSVGSVGERMKEVLKFCKRKGIRYCIVLEDDIAEFRHIKKGGVDGGSKISTTEEDWGGAYLKYYAKQSMKVMKEDPDCVLVGMRNRTMGNNESTSIIGYHDPMRGGCPNMVYFLDVEKFSPIYDTIPAEHYSPQYDWAIQCAIVRENKHWSIITGIVKNEYNSKSVICFSGDREQLAEEYLRYYGVEEQMNYRRFKDTELQGVKIFYKTGNYKEINCTEKLF